MKTKSMEKTLHLANNLKLKIFFKKSALYTFKTRKLTMYFRDYCLNVKLNTSEF